MSAIPIACEKKTIRKWVGCCRNERSGQKEDKKKIFGPDEEKRRFFVFKFIRLGVKTAKKTGGSEKKYKRPRG